MVFLKKYQILLFIFTLCLSQVQAASLILINHYDRFILFKIVINPDILADFPARFSLGKNKTMVSQINPLNKYAYLRGEDEEANYAFFSVGIKNSKTDIHGYMSRKIAYSWQQNIITFCTPEEFKQKGSC